MPDEGLAGFVYTLERRLVEPFDTEYSSHTLSRVLVGTPHVYCYASEPAMYLHLCGLFSAEAESQLSAQVEEWQHVQATLHHIRHPEALTPVLIGELHAPLPIRALQRLLMPLDFAVAESDGACRTKSLQLINERVLKHSESTGCDFYVIALDGTRAKYAFYDAAGELRKRKQALFGALLSALEQAVERGETI